MGQVEGGEETNQEQDVNVFTKGNRKGKDWHRPYQGAWNDRPNGTGYQGVCWGCGEIGHQQRECLKKIQNIDCDNLECDFFFGAVEAESIEAPPISDFERTFRRIRRGVKFGECSEKCDDGCGKYRNKTGNKFAELSEEGKENDDDDDDNETTTGEEKGGGGDENREEVPGLTGTDGEDNGEWKKAQNKKMKRVKKSEWKKM